MLADISSLTTHPNVYSLLPNCLNFIGDVAETNEGAQTSLNL